MILRSSVYFQAAARNCGLSGTMRLCIRIHIDVRDAVLLVHCGGGGKA